MFIGCSTNGFYPQLSPIAALTAIGILGFTHAELTLYHRRHYTEAAFRACGQAARAAGVSIDVVHLEPNEHRAFDPDRAVVTEAWENFDRAIAGAAQIGAKTVIWQGPMRAEYPIEAGFDPFLEVLYELDCRCQNAGIRLAIENTSVMMLSTLRDLMEIGPRLPSGVGYAFDPYAAAAAGANPMLLLRQMRGKLFSAHLHDFDSEGRRTGSLPPGDGTLPWSAILRAIHNAGFDGPLMLESVARSNPARSVAAVRALLEPIIAQVDAGPIECGSQPPAGLIEGIHLFNEGLYYECHEEIEHEWHAESGEIRDLYQGILQIGVGFHHASNGNLRGARLLLADGLDKLGRFLPGCLGIDTQKLWDQSAMVLADIDRRLSSPTTAPLVLIFPSIQID